MSPATLRSAAGGNFQFVLPPPSGPHHSSIKLRAINAGTASFFVIVVLAFETASSYLFLAASNFSLSTFFDPAQLFERGERGATLLQWASVLHSAGYVAAIPLALYLRNR